MQESKCQFKIRPMGDSTVRGGEKNRTLIPTTTVVALALSTTIVTPQERSGAVRADSTFESNKWPTTLLICSSVNDIFRSKFAKSPPLGTLPIIVR